MKKIPMLLITAVWFSVGSCSISPKEAEYNFEALRDTLNLDFSFVFVKECSPLYSDNNPYQFKGPRVKTLCYTVYYNEQTETMDTAVYAVLTDNSLVFWGKNEGNSHAKDLIEWTIKNREKV
jgi:hypothetical protein